jgi:hypothetical protein
MIQKHRISTNIGVNQKLTVELKQDFDLLELLSLKFTQKDVYASLCSDYGVVCGRITINNGLGIPNARISIFVPLSDEDAEDPVISALYPYRASTEKNESNYRYNLLPNTKQHDGHVPTGTFPDQTEILTREEVLEVYEKYYKYTVKTNDAGDFMIWGVSLGTQTIHVDVDLSDIGCFSFRPYDFIRQGIGPDAFENTYTFKSSEDLDSLPQIISFDKTIEVYPFWGNAELCEIGITRTDFDLSSVGVKLEPMAYVIGGTFTDIGKNSINKNCQVRPKMGRKCDLTTKEGVIEAIRFTNERDENNRPILEEYEINEDIGEDGSFVLPLPMNMDFIYTNEFGENDYTNDPNKGVPTSACYRLRIGIDDSGLARVRANADYLLPNIREYTNDIDKSYAFSTTIDDYPASAINEIILNKVDNQYFPKDYFYRFTYNKVYTVSSFQGSYYKQFGFSRDRFLGIKEIVPSEEEDCSSDVLTPPVNFAVKNFTFQILITEILLFFEQLINLLILTFFNTITRVFHSIADSTNVWPIRFLSNLFRNWAYQLQESGQRKLYLINFPECEECNDDEYGNVVGNNVVQYCEVGKISITGSDNQSNRLLNVSNFQSYNSYGTPYALDSNCVNAEIPTSYSNFVSNQTNYVITIGELTVDITSNLFTNSNTYDDSLKYFNDISTYELIIRDKRVKVTESNQITAIEEGCQLYDTPYDENIVYEYYSGTTASRKTIVKTSYEPGMDISSSRLANETSTKYFIPSTYDRITLSGYTEFSNGIFYIVPGTQTNNRLFDVLREYRRRKRVGTLFCGGIVNYSFIDNWLSGALYFFQFKAKQKNKRDEIKIKYCKDLVRYINDQEKFYYRSAEYNPTTNLFGTPIYKTTGLFTTSQTMYNRLRHPTTFVDLGPRDEFINQICIDPQLDPNCAVARNIGPTSFQSFGELMAFGINYRMDISNNTFDIDNFFDNNGFDQMGFKKVLDGDLLQLISINNETGIREFDLQDSNYIGYSYQYLDPEVNPDVFKNGNQAYGPTPITLTLDEDGKRVRLCLNEPGRLTETSQDIPFFLWDKKGTGFGSYLPSISDDQSWDYTRNGIKVMPLQGMTFAYKFNGQNDNPSDKYLLLPMTYTYSGKTISNLNVTESYDFDVIDNGGVDRHTFYDDEYPGFTYLYVTSGTDITPINGILYTRYGSGGTWDIKNWNNTMDFIIKKTEDYYNGNKQILSTPFLFYFGLRPGKTGLDKFMKLYGPLGAFKQ